MAKIAGLGCGRIGRMHAANIRAHSRASDDLGTKLSQVVYRGGGE